MNFVLLAVFVIGCAFGQKDWRLPEGKVPMYNTAKQKLNEGKPLVGVTITSTDPNVYCAAANAGFDYTWIEMQHNPMTYADVAKMIWACRGATAMPFIRVPDATESDIQKATDMGALGVIVPTVDTVEKAENAVKWAKYPPHGRRSMGMGQYRDLYGPDYRQTINDNMVVVIMIETPLGVANAKEIAAVPGIDVIFAAATDLSNFSGTKQGDKKYEEMVTKIHDETLKKKIRLGGPLAWTDRPGFTFFQAGAEVSFIKIAAPIVLGKQVAIAAPAKKKEKGVAELEGQEKK